VTRSELQALMDAPLNGPRGRKRGWPVKFARKEPEPRGHVLTPGSGPTGAKCGGCVHLARIELSKTYLKCGLARARWTGGRATDIRAGDDACRLFEAVS
jgi:hypothetical protein